MNIANWLYIQGKKSPELPAIYHGTESLFTYRQFATMAYQYGQILRVQYHCAAGDRVVLYASNRFEYLIALYAIFWIGAVIVPVNYRLHPKELEWVLEDTGSKLILSDNGNLSEQITIADNITELSLAQLESICLNSTQADFTMPYTRRMNDLAWLFYTSGTTGRPKGVMLSHENLIAMSLCVETDVLHLSHEDCMYYVAPLSHGAGLYNFIAVRKGVKHILPKSKSFSASDLFKLAPQLKNICIFTAPTMLKRITEVTKKEAYNGEGLKTIICGGAPLYAVDFFEAEQQLGPVISQIYGQGETPMTITALSTTDLLNLDKENKETIISTVGTPHSCVEVAIVDESMQPLANGTPGEIVVRGTTVMKGYWNNPKATAETIIDGWLKTGDIGFLNDSGYLTLTDRSKDVIISGGINIYPREVEEVLLKHEDVSEVSVLGAQSQEWGEIVTAHVVLKTKNSIDEEDLKNWSKDFLASFKCPKKIYFHQKLPKNAYGKVVKAELLLAIKENSN